MRRVAEVGISAPARRPIRDRADHDDSGFLAPALALRRLMRLAITEPMIQ
jgi:hypothetical protein